MQDGNILVLEGAWDVNKNSPVTAFLEALRWSTRPKQRARYEAIMERFEYYAAYGTLEPKLQLQFIEDSMYEIKTSEDRLLFYPLDATTRHKRAARLTHGFEKRLGKTAQGKLPEKIKRLARAIAREDKAHG